MAAWPLPTKLELEVVTPEGLLLREEVDEVIAPGERGLLRRAARATRRSWPRSGMGEITLPAGAASWRYLTCFWGFCEVLPDRVNILAEIGERAEDIDVGARGGRARSAPQERMKTIADEAGFEEAHQAYMRAVTRLAVARRRRAAPEPQRPPRACAAA